MRVVAPCSSAGALACGSAASKKASSCACVRSATKPVERVAFHRRGQRLAHDGGADHHAERVEGDFGPVAVRVADEARLQHAVVVGVHRDAVAERVAGFDHQQVVGVEVDEGVLAEGVAVAARQEEVLPRLRQLGGGVVGGIRC